MSTWRCAGCGEDVPAEAVDKERGSHPRVVTETIYEDVVGHERRCYEASACSCSGVLEGRRPIGERPIGEEECGPVQEATDECCGRKFTRSGLHSHRRGSHGLAPQYLAGTATPASSDTPRCSHPLSHSLLDPCPDCGASDTPKPCERCGCRPHGDRRCCMAEPGGGSCDCPSTGKATTEGA